MPFYFAYGSNMDERAMRARCPKARVIAPARLMRHRFFIMGNGYASVRTDPSSDVHGVLFDLALSDIPPLDRYEDVARGLYVKVTQPLVRRGGPPVRALVYIGTDTTIGGASPARYIEDIVAAARTASLPVAYIAMLESWGQGTRPRIAKPL